MSLVEERHGFFVDASADHQEGCGSGSLILDISILLVVCRAVVPSASFCSSRCGGCCVLDGSLEVYVT